MNKAYRRQIFREEDLELDIDEIDRRIYQTPSPLLQEYRKFAEQLKKSGKQETFYYTGNGSYLCFTGQVIAQNKGRAVIRGSLLNLSRDVAKSAVEKLDTKLGELNHLFELVLWVRPDQNEISPLLGNLKYASGTEENGAIRLREGLTYLANEVVFPPDIEHYNAFLDFDTLRQRIDASPSGYVADIFRFKQKDGSYKPEEILIMRIPAIDSVEYLYCMKPCVLSGAGLGSENAELVVKQEDAWQEYAGIWEQVLWRSRLMFFWKDKERRFRGVSKSVLEYFGIEDDSLIIGKTEEEMGWTIDTKEIAQLEQQILTKGAKQQDQPGRVIVGGLIQEVVCSRMPLYQNGKIVGILGRFEDLKLESRKMNQKQKSIRTDAVTGLMNAQAFLDAVKEFSKIHRKEGKVRTDPFKQCGL